MFPGPGWQPPLGKGFKPRGKKLRPRRLDALPTSRLESNCSLAVHSPTIRRVRARRIPATEAPYDIFQSLFAHDHVNRSHDLLGLGDRVDPIAFYLLAAAILFGGSMLQSATGFGYGMFAVNLLLLTGAAPYEAIPMISLAVLVNAGGGVIRHRRDVPWLAVLPILPAALLAQPVGVYLLGRMVQGLSRPQVRQVFGAILLAVLALRTWFRPRPRGRLGAGWGLAAMGLCGIGSGMAGMGGPPVVLWCLAHDWPNARIRATLWLTFGVIGMTNLFWQYQRFGSAVISAVGVGALLTPAALAGMWPGLWIGARLSRANLQRAAVAILVIIGLYAILQPLVA